MVDHGAGTAPAGTTFVGADAIQDPSAVGRLLHTELVPLYDLGTRTFPRNPVTGFLKLVHWVDQAVELALGITNGSFTAQSSLGNKLRSIKRAGGNSLQANVLDAVQIALAVLLTRKDILVVDIAISTPIRGQIVVAPTYINLRRFPQASTTLRSAF